MGETTGITWTDHTFNGWWGCQRVSPGCENCYAEAFDRRVGGGVDPNDPINEAGETKKKLRWGPSAPRIRTSAANWRGPLSWNKKAEKLGVRRRVFCSSMADVFEDRPELKPWRADLFELIRATPALDWQLLTKRPQNFSVMLPWSGREKPWPNVWLGTTVEDNARAELRIPRLIAVSAVVKFLSLEPMLEAIDLGLPTKKFHRSDGTDGCDHCCNGDRCDEPEHTSRENCERCRGTGSARVVDWVIVGGESGAAAREFDLSWAHDVQRQCRQASVAFFCKQLGARPVSADPECGDDREFRLVDAHGGDWAEWPAPHADGLKVREFPVPR